MTMAREKWDAEVEAIASRFDRGCRCDDGEWCWMHTDSADNRLTDCPNCEGTGKVLGAWDIEEDCPADGCADGRVTIAERDAILERLDGLQHRSRP